MEASGTSGEKAGLNVTWNTMLNQEEITSNPTSEQIKNVEVNTMSANTTIEYDPITGLPVGAELVMRDKNGISYKTIEYNNKTYISESGLKIYGFVYVSGGTFRNRTTGETVSINSFKENALSVDGTMYFDIRLFANKIGE
jgi:hypothetical protein